MSADIFKRLAQVALGDTPTTIYTAPADRSAIVKALFVANVSGAQQAVQVWHGGSADANKILPATTLQTGEYGTYDGAITMEPGDTLLGQCSSAAGVTVSVEGMEIA